MSVIQLSQRDNARCMLSSSQLQVLRSGLDLGQHYSACADRNGKRQGSQTVTSCNNHPPRGNGSKRASEREREPPRGPSYLVLSGARSGRKEQTRLPLKRHVCACCGRRQKRAFRGSTQGWKGGRASVMVGCSRQQNNDARFQLHLETFSRDSSSRNRSVKWEKGFSEIVISFRVPFWPRLPELGARYKPVGDDAGVMRIRSRYLIDASLLRHLRITMCPAVLEKPTTFHAIPFGFYSGIPSTSPAPY